MGIADVKAAWSVAAPDYPCTGCTMHLDRSSGKEMQVLIFEGITPAGEAFTLTTDPFDPNLDPVAQAAKAGADFVTAYNKQKA